MLFKRCFKCLLELPLDAFYKHPNARGGRQNKCIDCTKKDVAAHRLANIDRIRQYDRARASQPHRLEKNKRTTADWRRANPKRWAAQIKLNNALRAGRVQKTPCMVCGERAEAHHPDYDQPLDVVWLCPAHHKQVHAMARKAA
jgi:hypothetical protein